MIPCYSLFLEVEIPDPSLNYFVLDRDETENETNFLAPNIAQQDTITVKTDRGYSTLITLVEDEYWYVGVSYPLNAQDEYQFERSVFIENKQNPDALDANLTISLESDPSQTIYTAFNDPSNYWADFTMPAGQDNQDDKITIVGLTKPVFPFEYGDITHEFAWTEYCLSGLNTFVLEQSCMDGNIDLLEGWGAAQPNYAWVDLITDTTEIDIERGFDTRQGVVGTPIAGVMSATIMDPYLDALNTQRVAIGQRCRLRAGGTIVFTGVVNTLRSDYNAVDTPTLYLESVDALGLLNAQMVDARPQENYKTRLTTAVEKVGLRHYIEETTTELNPTEDAMSALDLLVETQDSEGSICWLDRYGIFYSTNRYWKNFEGTRSLRNSEFYSLPSFTFTNATPNEIGVQGEEVCLSSYKQSADTREVINGITFYNYTEEEDEGTDENGQPITEKIVVRDTHTFESGNSRRLYGDAGVKLTTYLNPSTLPAYADYIFLNYDTPQTKVESIQFPLDKWRDLSVPNTTKLDIGDAVYVRIDDPFSGQVLQHANQRITKIKHQISPTEWLCELELL